LQSHGVNIILIHIISSSWVMISVFGHSRLLLWTPIFSLDLKKYAQNKTG